jgi:hypothetical protein
VADLEQTMSRLAATHPHGTVIPSWRLEQARKERQRRAEVVSSTLVIASGPMEQRDGETAKA